MGEENNKQQVVGSEYNLDAKWDACLDLGVRRFAYFSLIGGFAGLLLFRSPVTRWASTAFGAGTGIGSAYTECSQIFGGYPGKSTASVSETPITKDGEE
ncbi:MICOS complex subunit MIC10-like [Lycium barbarum]|uniref:MICOS complex subunit MIC10-like n=1 Tax=Lycium barbarum TaxID=112863 RepID=UPI00293E90B9|nr:MICOS complex subunit MIC10-like [Lycium barbarum]